MSTILHENETTIPVPLKKGMKVVIVQADWNAKITDALAAGARETLLRAGIDDSNITIVHVPGTVELTYGARKMMDRLHPDAVIIVGCVIRGDTPHFDYVCESATYGCTILNAEGKCPVIFCVLTTENEQQALDRAGGFLGNKGSEGAVAAIRMANLDKLG